MSDNIFIPKKIKVGFQNRDDTYTKRLAYVVYYDNKGVLRKEKSWNSWRDQKIEPKEYDNNPQDGFILNKGIQRYGWSHFSSNRSYIRIYDSRGIEFEITPENLIGILMETTCSKRELEGKFVYAWCGSELVLLPCGSEEYQKAVKYTDRQDLSISATELKPGCSYTTKKGEEVIYLGKFKYDAWNYTSNRKRKFSKKFVFASPKKSEYDPQIFVKSDIGFLAILNNPEPVPNYAELMESLNKDISFFNITGFECKQAKNVIEIVKDNWAGWNLKKRIFIEQSGDDLIIWRGSVKFHRENNEYVVKGYFLDKEGIFNTKTFKYDKYENRYGYYSYSNYDRPYSLSLEEITNRVLKCVDVSIVLENGRKTKFLAY